MIHKIESLCAEIKFMRNSHTHTALCRVNSKRIKVRVFHGPWNSPYSVLTVLGFARVYKAQLPLNS